MQKLTLFKINLFIFKLLIKLKIIKMFDEALVKQIENKLNKTSNFVDNREYFNAQLELNNLKNILYINNIDNVLINNSMSNLENSIKNLKQIKY